STSVRIVLDGNARAAVLGAKRRGLICEVKSLGLADGSELVMSGPLAMFRPTRIYGNALASLLRVLPWSARLEVDATLVVAGQRGRWTLRGRFLLRPQLRTRVFDSRLEEQLAKALAKEAPQ